MQDHFNRMFIDASFNSSEDGAGHSAFVTFVGTAATIVKSSKQKIGTKDQELDRGWTSSIILWLHAFLKSLGVPLVLYQVNKSTNALMQPLLNKKLRCRYLNANRRVMYDEIMVNKSVDSAHFQAGQMTADVLSKPVYGAQFFKFTASILGGGSHTKR